MIEHAAVRGWSVTKRNYTVRAIWDDKAKVFYSESDIVGFHIEANTIEEFQSLMHENALELIVENHIDPEDLLKKTVIDLIPTIFWERSGPASEIAAE